MLVRIEGSALPGLECGDYTNIHVGPQKKKEVVELTPGDAKTATWSFDVEIKANGDFGGPFVQGKKGDRFFYLCWGVLLDPKTKAFAMFRRAKLMIADIPPKVLEKAVNAPDKTVLVGKIGLTDSKGMPICARVKPPAITWSTSRL